MSRGNDLSRNANDRVLRIAPEASDDYERIRSVTLAAFSDHRSVANLVELIRRSPEYIPDLSLVAREDESIVGHVMLSRADLVDQNQVRHRVVVLSPLSVVPEYQRQGVGGKLVISALHRAEHLGERLVILDGSPRYYPRFGFRQAVEFDISINLPDWAPLEAAMVYPLTGYQPSINGRLSYPPAFTLFEDPWRDSSSR